MWTMNALIHRGVMNNRNAMAFFDKDLQVLGSGYPHNRVDM